MAKEVRLFEGVVSNTNITYQFTIYHEYPNVRLEVVIVEIFDPSSPHTEGDVYGCFLDKKYVKVNSCIMYEKHMVYDDQTIKIFKCVQAFEKYITIDSLVKLVKNGHDSMNVDVEDNVVNGNIKCIDFTITYDHLDKIDIFNDSISYECKFKLKKTRSKIHSNIELKIASLEAKIDTMNAYMLNWSINHK